MKAADLDSAQIARLLLPYVTLSAGQLSQTRDYVALLLKWNARVNLTAVRDPEHIVTRHFGESFFAASALVPHGWRGRVIDVGSGAGFPGVPLAIWAPQAEVTLIESNSKKAAFLSEVIRALGLKNARVAGQRAELFSGSAELATMRAVEQFEKSMLAAMRLVAPGGRLSLMIGKGQLSTAEELGRGFEWAEAIPLPGGHSRVLLVGTKSATVGNLGD
ncbi:MAG TPA: 16S rRNA (guanine(527)-N(7))-methyltransferase RsmG [Candidatus Angelobacter sp.]